MSFFSRDLFVPRYDSFPMNPEKKDTNSLIGPVQCKFLPVLIKSWPDNQQDRHFC